MHLYILVRNFLAVALATVLLAPAIGDAAVSKPAPVPTVVALLNAPSPQQDYMKAADLMEQLVGSDSDAAIDTAFIDRLVDAARQMAGPNPTDSYKLAAIRKAIYVAGPWNYNKAFSYDLADPFGQVWQNRLLSTYIRTRKGNCVSMPILFLIIADRIGLNVHLAIAPLHMFVRYTDPQGVDHNLETTSGGHEARTEWYRENLPMSDKSIATGVYMRTLSKRESIAEITNIVVDFLLDQRRYQEAVEVADAILAVNPREAYTLVKRGTAIGGLMQIEFVDKYPDPALIPASLRPRYLMLAQQNEKAFKDAESLGWEPTK